MRKAIQKGARSKKARGAKQPSRRNEHLRAIERAKKKSALYRIIRIARSIDEEAIRRASEGELMELRRGHLALLPHLDAEGTRITTLAERLGVTKQAASQTVSELEGLGLLERIPDPNDGRAKLVTLTDAGWERILGGLEILLELERELSRHLPRGGLAALRGLLDPLDDALRERDADAEPQPQC